MWLISRAVLLRMIPVHGMAVKHLSWLDLRDAMTVEGSARAL